MECEHAVGAVPICATCYQRGLAAIKATTDDLRERMTLLWQWEQGTLDITTIITTQE